MDDYSHCPVTGKRRARGLGILFDGKPGPLNLITDVADVFVGLTTLIKDGTGMRGDSVRTGVTIILPKGKERIGEPYFCAYFSLNGNGELTGTHMVEELGEARWPIGLTNTHSCGMVRDAIIRWVTRTLPTVVGRWGVLPIVGETFDGELNDINGFHVEDRHVFEAIETASPGPFELGSVGGGTGMICFDFKGGTGSASRVVEIKDSAHVLGVLVQANFGARHELTVQGIPVGRFLSGGEVRFPHSPENRGNSIIVVVATNAPLLPHQLKRLCRRVSIGLAKTGSTCHGGSGDIFFAFSTADTAHSLGNTGICNADFIENVYLNPLFEAVEQATEEAIIDSMVTSREMTGRNGVTVRALPHVDLTELLRSHRAVS